MTGVTDVTSALAGWDAPPEGLSLGEGEVHVWRAALDLDQEEMRRLWQTLSADESARARRFHFPLHRRRFVAGRGLLRAILARYLHRDPIQLCFRDSPHGKPELTAGCGSSGIQFNLSHTQEIALYAVALNRRVGIDVEHVSGFSSFKDEISERFFSPSEAATLRALPPYARPRAFFSCWTRKEAYLKATGEGLAVPLDQFEVSLMPGEPAELLSIPWDSEEAAQWSLCELHPGLDLVGTLCVEGQRWQPKCWQWPRKGAGDGKFQADTVAVVI